MIDGDHGLSIAKQVDCQTGEGSRDQPRQRLLLAQGGVASDTLADLATMRRMDELHLDVPFAGSRMLRDLLNREGIEIGRRHVATLMKRMGIAALDRKPNASKPAPGHKIYPYPLRGVTVDRPDQAWAMDFTYVPMARGFVYLAGLVDWHSRRVLAWRLSITMEVAFCVEALEEALARHLRQQPARAIAQDSCQWIISNALG